MCQHQPLKGATAVLDHLTSQDQAPTRIVEALASRLDAAGSG